MAQESNLTELVQKLLDDEIKEFDALGDSKSQAGSGARRVILPGSFNPLHPGHTKLLDDACRQWEKAHPGERCYKIYEMSVKNADKSQIDAEAVKERSLKFPPGETLVVTPKPFYYEKAELFPNSVFVVGADTIVRILDPKYYGETASKDQAKMQAMLEKMRAIKAYGCHFLVAGRVVKGVYKELSDIQIPPEVQDLQIMDAIPGFREDISSTELRDRSSRG